MDNHEGKKKKRVQDDGRVKGKNDVWSGRSVRKESGRESGEWKVEGRVVSSDSDSLST